MEARNFIKETIDSLKDASLRIEMHWAFFQAGRMTKKEFEDEYKNILSNIKEDLENEYYDPNNGCKYNDTCPTEYFAKENI